MDAMKVSVVAKALDSIAPSHLAADWDNVGLLVGNADAPVGKVLLCIDLTQAVLNEAIKAKAQMVVAYHPVILKPVARVTAAAAPVVHGAIRAGLSVYCPHTALDAVPGGTNDVLADVLGLRNRRPLEPLVRRDECKIVVFVPPTDLSRVAEAAFSAGAGRIGNYYDCAFFGHGIGAFCGSEAAHPAVGRVGRHEAAEELRLEVIAPRAKAAAVCEAITSAHGYEQPAIDVYPLEDYPEGCGLGRVGWLERAQTVNLLIARIKRATGLKKVLVAPVRHSARKGGARSPRVSVAACGAGSCGELYRAAVGGGATFYLTGEMRHHDLLAATAAGMTVVCLGHSNSERLALPALAKRMQEACPRLRAAISKLDRDPLEVV
jgi:dinuclear metal center YbgI/SA1388 family protein